MLYVTQGTNDGLFQLLFSMPSENTSIGGCYINLLPVELLTAILERHSVREQRVQVVVGDTTTPASRSMAICRSIRATGEVCTMVASNCAEPNRSAWRAAVPFFLRDDPTALSFEMTP